MNAAALASVSKSFGVTPVLTDICLEFPAGTVTAVVGESGCGKSTLLEHLNGLHRPDTGTVSVLGKPIDYSTVVELRRQIGYAVQGTGLFPHLSAAANIELLPRLAGWAPEKTEPRKQQLMKLFGLSPDLAARYPYQLSGGQRQRFGLCRAMMLRPPLLLLDEPFSGVDPMTRHAIHREFLRLQQEEPTTVVLVTHDLREARKLAQHLVIIRAGKIAQSGLFDEVAETPADRYVATLLRDHLQ